MKRLQEMETAPVPAVDESRACERAPSALLVSYTIDANYAPEHTETYDIATGGMAITTNARLAANLDIIIALELRGDPGPALRLSGSVRWSTYDAVIGKYRTGVSFTDPPSDVEPALQRYIDTLHILRSLGSG